MIIKYKNEKGFWSWVANIESISEVSRGEPDDDLLVEYDVDYFDVYGDDRRKERVHCYLIHVRDRKPRLAIFYTDELYLTDDLTGSTIEILVAPHGKTKV